MQCAVLFRGHTACLPALERAPGVQRALGEIILCLSELLPNVSRHTWERVHHKTTLQETASLKVDSLLLMDDTRSVYCTTLPVQGLERWDPTRQEVGRAP